MSHPSRAVLDFSQLGGECCRFFIGQIPIYLAYDDSKVLVTEVAALLEKRVAQEDKRLYGNGSSLM
jgi:hypothetical protein